MIYASLCDAIRTLPINHFIYHCVNQTCPSWCSIVGATVTVHQFFCILLLLYFTLYTLKIYMKWYLIYSEVIKTSILRVLLKAIHFPHRPQQIQIFNHYFAPRKIRKTNFEQRAITREKVGQPWRKSNLICNSSYGSLLPTFIQICESIAKKSPEN